MLRLPPICTLPDTLFPDPTLFRSDAAICAGVCVEAAVRRTSSVVTAGLAAGSLGPVAAQPERVAAAINDSEISLVIAGCLALRFGGVTHIAVGGDFAARGAFDRLMLRMGRSEAQRSDESRLGKECVSTC